MHLTPKKLLERINFLQYTMKTFSSLESITINNRFNLKNKINYIENNIIDLMYLLKSFQSIDNKKCNDIITYIFIGGDNSLCGSYNNEILKKIKNIIKNNLENWRNNSANIIKKINFLIIGKKIKKITKELEKVKSLLLNIEITITHYLTKNLQNHWNVINNFINNNQQLIFVINDNHFPEIITKEILLEKFSTGNNNSQFEDDFFFFLEGTKKDIISKMKNIFNNYLFYYMLYNAQMQENIARLYFLKNSVDNCKKEIQTQTIIYRTLRQELITRELNELIVSNL